MQTILSDDRLYRYTLWRQWTTDADPPFAMFIGLNPSTADETQDDPTIRKCIGFAKQWGMGGLCMTNLFAWRDTDPEKMKKVTNPVGDENDVWLLVAAKKAHTIIAAWGNDGDHQGRNQKVMRAIRSTGKDVLCLRKNKNGTPGHPLYIPYSANPAILSP